MRVFPFPLAAFALFSVFLSPQSISSQEKTPMNVKRLTTVLLVKEIEPVIPFWVDRLGFAKTIAGRNKSTAWPPVLRSVGARSTTVTSKP